MSSPPPPTVWAAVKEASPAPTGTTAPRVPPDARSATMVGPALWARKPDRAEPAVWRAARYNMAFLGAIGALFVGFAPVLVTAFTDDPAVAGHAVACLRIVSAGFLFYAYGMVLTSAFNGAGDTWTPTWINFFCFWLWEIPLAWLLSQRTPLGPNGAFLAIMIAFSTLALVSLVIFRRGRWKGVQLTVAANQLTANS